MRWYFVPQVSKILRHRVKIGRLPSGFDILDSDSYSFLVHISILSSQEQLDNSGMLGEQAWSPVARSLTSPGSFWGSWRQRSRWTAGILGKAGAACSAGMPSSRLVGLMALVCPDINKYCRILNSHPGESDGPVRALTTACRRVELRQCSKRTKKKDCCCRPTLPVSSGEKHVEATT
jgi:hypothetical protein